MNEYVSYVVRQIGEYTKEGKDEEVKEVLRKVLPKRAASFQPTDKFTYNGLDIVDGELQILYSYKYLGRCVACAVFYRDEC